MPVKQRTAKARRRVFDPEVIALFVELERMPRTSPQFEEGSRALAERLDLMNEWFMRQNVSDRSAEPPQPWLCAHQAWFRCRAVREQLLAAAGEAGLRVAGG
jgi:hypothetical protein